jgi:hypothetical protein
MGKSFFFFAEQNEKLHTLYTDGAPVILGTTSGFPILMETEAPHVVTHCFLRTCTGNKISSNDPGRSFINSHKIHELYQKQVSESSHL